MLLSREQKMKHQNRRNFLKTAGMAATVAAIPRTQSRAESAPPSKTRRYPFELGIASYTFRNFTLDQAIAMTQRLAITRLTAKDVHLPMKDSDEELHVAVSKIKQAGITLDSYGVIYMKSEEEVSQAFSYGKKAGVKLIVGSPEPALLPVVDRFVKETGLTLAIHNHGPTDKNFPSPESVYKAVANFDRRIGLCIDVGHTLRIGLDPVAQFRQCFDRVFDFHLKDITAAQPDAKDVEVGRGVMNVIGLLKEAQQKGYDGTFHFEYEKDPNDPLPGVAESVGYVRGVLAVM
jgi:inosose dehydratase